jgi:type VI secretion system secreted protein Hcp
MNMATRKWSFLVFLTFSLSAVSVPTWGALTSYMKITGRNQGDIKGDCEQSGDKKDTILVYGVDHELEIPRDTHTGLPTGQRIQHPLTIVKAIDSSTPKLYQAICTGESLNVTLDFYRIAPDGTEENYFRIKLDNAIIVNCKLVKLNTLDPNYKPYHDMEEVSFTFDRITWTYLDGNIEYTDSWRGN